MTIQDRTTIPVMMGATAALLLCCAIRGDSQRIRPIEEAEKSFRNHTDTKACFRSGVRIASRRRRE